VQTETFEIVANPNAEATVADMQKQHDFISDVNKSVDRAHQSIKKIKKINNQLKSFTTQYKDDERTADLREKAKTMQEEFGKIEKELYQTKNRSGQDPLNFPIKLTNKLGHLNSLVGMGDFGPTDQDVAVKNELTAAINAQLDAFDTMLDAEVTKFNDEFNSLKLDYLFVEDAKE
jgi:endonuclease/exonuclease/phosphatase family metal-dependent hydrolase